MSAKIFCWVNSGKGSDWQVVMALAEDGTHLASHVSSSEFYAKHDIGITSDWKHEAYKKHYPDGYELVWVDDATPGKCPGLDEAYARNQAMRPAAVEVRSADCASEGEVKP